MTTQERLKELVELLNQPFIVEYAYPTSDHARTLGHYRTGCYYVSRFVDINTPRMLATSHGYTTREEAQAYADILSKT